MTLPHTPLHILVAPLDWGLGHTSRCVPIIRHMLGRGCVVTTAGTDWQQSFYQQTFPEEVASGKLRPRALAGYNVQYAKSRRGFLPRILSQFPRLMRTVRAEHRWLSSFVREEKIDGILSDNRYGLHHPRVPSVILTHQVSPRTGMGDRMDALMRRLHYRALQKFGACWIVDTAREPGMSSALAHPRVLPRNAQHIGLLSQFSGETQQVLRSNSPDGPLLVLLSGPEPQRTLLSQKLWAQVLQYSGKVVFVEGREDAQVPGAIPSHITHHSRLTATTLKPLLEAASTVVCRSGYSTLMDLMALGKRAVIIPTPGQTEQEYLAQTLANRGLFATARQEKFSLSTALARLNAGPQKDQNISADDFRTFHPVVDNWLATL
jgi:UDP:flavonoid glycosyltransferase YjiC (YdhE family)